MLIGIAPCISPELLSALYKMGHGDEIVLADAFFPGDSCNSRVIRADGIEIPRLLEGILALINLDGYVPSPVMMMAPTSGDSLDPAVVKSYRDLHRSLLARHATDRTRRALRFLRAR